MTCVSPDSARRSTRRPGHPSLGGLQWCRFDRFVGMRGQNWAPVEVLSSGRPQTAYQCELARDPQARIPSWVTDTYQRQPERVLDEPQSQAGRTNADTHAVVKYGQAALQSTYKEMVNFAFATGWNSALIARNSAYLSRADLAVAASYMTDAARKDMLTILAKVTQGDNAATSKLEESIFFGLTSPDGLKPLQTGKVVTNRKFTQGSAALDTSHGTRLAMSFAARGDIQMVDASGKHHMLRTSQVLRYLLVPNSGVDREVRPFLIDSWSSKMTMNNPVAAS